MNFLINEKRGYQYSIKSGDRNKIHTDNITGYNSFFGEKIVHGTLILQTFLKLVKIKQQFSKYNKFYIGINFLKHFSYNEKIIYKSKTNNLYQHGKICADIELKKSNKVENIKITKKKYIVNFRKKAEDNFEILFYLLDILSKYVGMVYPGENSIIQNIKINYNEKYKLNDKKVLIYSKKLSRKFPIILNKIVFNRYLIYFTTSERPKLNFKKINLSNKLKNLVKKIQEPILIIGSSSGIGHEVLDLFKFNKNVPIFGTYYKNKFSVRNTNIKIFKFNVSEDILLLKKRLEKYNNIRIYYFATPKIDLYNNLKSKINDYENFYINYPNKILKIFRNKKISFFYPSTIFVEHKNSKYAMIKKKAEKCLSKLKNHNTIINILRISEINTRQNLSLIKNNLPNFIDILKNNENYVKKLFFIK